MSYCGFKTSYTGTERRADKNEPKALCCSIIFHIFLINRSVIGSFSVLVVSVVRWRHLKEQVSQVVCSSVFVFIYLPYVVWLISRLHSIAVKLKFADVLLQI